MQLETLLAKLKAAIDQWNADLDEALECGDVTASEAAALRVPPGSVTETLVRSDSWPLAFTRAVESLHSEEHPREIMAMSKSVKEPTAITTALYQGSRKAKGIMPVMVKTADLAHLVARAARTPHRQDSKSPTSE